MTPDEVKTYEWLYLARGKVTHAFPLEDRFKWLAECGTVSYAWWYGTGSQDEYDKAAALPKCKRCLPKVGASDKGRRKPREVR